MKEENQKVFVGQVLYKELSSRYSNTIITEHRVIKVGKKYFECTDLRDKITISSLMYESKMYSHNNYQLYRTQQEILDKNEISKLYLFIKEAFRNHINKDFSLDCLRKINNILLTNSQ